ncbi:MAG: ABC transporter permease, partial [Rhodobacterales bacterium]|nr:ABC transporter permease [Rhodobacterales bacterium]
MMKIDWTRNETLVALVILGFCLLAALSDPGFLSIATLTDLLRGGIVLGIFAVAAMLVLISGGIDVSFTAVAAVTMYVTAMVLNAAMPWMPWWGAIAFGMAVGACLGAINGVLIAGFGLPTLIVTLGTLSIFRGFMLTFVGQKQITTLPPGMREFGRMMLVRGENAD